MLFKSLSNSSIVSCKKEPLNPDRFKFGTFEIPAGKGYEKTIIIRQDSIQIEKYVDRINLMNVMQEEVSKSCPKCGSQDRQITEKDIVDLLEELSANIGSKMEVISSKTEEGAQLGSLGNIGALLRFKDRKSVV